MDFIFFFSAGKYILCLSVPHVDFELIVSLFDIKIYLVLRVFDTFFNFILIEFIDFIWVVFVLFFLA